MESKMQQDPLGFNVPERDFDWSLSPEKLRKLYKETNFDSFFLNLISKDVIKILSPQLVQEPHNLVYDEDLIYEHLIGPLEKFICNLDQNASKEEVEKTLNHIESLNEPKKVCRRILKNGDVSFSCNDCGLDGTCVVCIDCFHKSVHKNHNYRMYNSEGGCCDCGDVEAWKQNYACSDHIDSTQSSLTPAQFEDKKFREKYIEDDRKSIIQKISVLPKSVALRYFLICQASLHYAKTLAIWSSGDDDTLPFELDNKLKTISEQENDLEMKTLISKDKSSKNYFTVLFNDEVHTYDYVINMLVKVISCSKLTASIIASTISRVGRSLIFRGTEEACDEKRLAFDGPRGQRLRCEVMHGSVLAYEAYALILIEWIRKMSSISDAFRILTACTLLGKFDMNLGSRSELEASSLLELIMLTNTFYWKIVRIEWNDLFVQVMLTDYTIKTEFAKSITRLYPTLMKRFVDDDHDQSVSILSLVTQLYTVVSLIRMLVEEENALGILTKTLSSYCVIQDRDSFSNNYEHRYTLDIHTKKRSFFIMMHIKFLIAPEPTNWTPKLRENVFEGVKNFIDILNSMQGMDSFRRQLGQHLEFEPEWESGLNLQNRLTSLITRFVKYCSRDEEVLLRTLKLAQEKLIDWIVGGFKRCTIELFGHKATCIVYDVSIAQVSIHLPLTRFVAALIIELMKRRPNDKIPYDESLVILTLCGANDTSTTSSSSTTTIGDHENQYLLIEKSDIIDTSGGETTTSATTSIKQQYQNSMIDIMELSLRTQVMIAQFRSNMWRRNGYSLVNQIVYFHSAYIRKEMFDRDILVMQECAAMTEANEFLIHLLNKFQLSHWVTQESTRDLNMSKLISTFHNEEDILAQTMSLGEEFLQLLLTITGERYRSGIGMDIKDSDVMKHEVIQLLCISSATRSDLSQRLIVKDKKLECVKEIANLRRSNETSTGKYELKEEYYDQFNPFFYHYSRRQQSNALDAQLKRKKNLKHQLICCPPPKPLELTKQFLNLNEILKCDITLIIISKILNRAKNPPSNTKDSLNKAALFFPASDLQLDQSLHLIGMGLHEQERYLMEFDYLTAAHKKSIFLLLKDVYEKPKRSRDLILWLMKKTNDIIELLYSKCHIDEATKETLNSIKDELKPILSSCDTSLQDNRKRNSEMAIKRRERILAMMKANQDKFLSSSDAKQLAIETEKNNPQPKNSNQPQTSTTAHSALTPQASTSGAQGYTTRSGRKTKPPKSFDFEQQQQLKTTSSVNMQSEDQPMEYDVLSDTDKNDTESVNMEEMESDRHQAVEAEISHLCILCRDEQKIGFNQPTMVLMAHIQRSTVLSKNRIERRIPNYALTPTNQLKHQFVRPAPGARRRSSTRLAAATSSFESPPYLVSRPSDEAVALEAFDFGVQSPSSSSAEMYSYTSDNSWSFDATFMPSDLFFGPHVTTCGHVMHYDCWKGFYNAISRRETNRSGRNNRHVSFELEKNEILCPLCESISNATIPLLPYYNRRFRSPAKLNSIFLNNGNDMGANSLSDNLSACLHALRGAVDMFKHIRHIKEVHTKISINYEDKYIRLLQPRNLNDVLEELEEVEALGLRDFLNTIRSNKILSSSCHKDILTCIQTFAERIHTVGLDLDSSISDTNHARIFMMTSWSISYTVQTSERLARIKGVPLFEDLESSKNLCLSSLIRFAYASMMTHQSDMLQSLLVRKLRYLLINEEHLSSSPCCLDIDAFETLVSIIILLQKLYSHTDDNNHFDTTSSEIDLSPPLDAATTPPPQFTKLCGNSPRSSERKASESSSAYGWTTTAFDHEYFRNVIHLMLLLDSIQVIISMHNELAACSEEDLKAKKSSSSLDDPRSSLSIDNEEHQTLSNFYRDMILASGHSNNTMPNVDEKFCTIFKQRLLPFLRSCAIFFHHLTQTPPPEALIKRSAFLEGKDIRYSDNNVDNTITTDKSLVSQHSQAMDVEDGGDIGPDISETEDAIKEEFSTICIYLGLPDKFKLLYQSQEARHLARSWLRHSRVLLLIKSSQCSNEDKQHQQQREQAVEEAWASAEEEIQDSEEEFARKTPPKGDMVSASPKVLHPSPLKAVNLIPTSAHPSSTDITGTKPTSSSSELMPVKLIRQPHLVNRLIELPFDYSELVDKVSDFPCPSIKNEDSKTPTMCLVCGAILCSQSYCCQRDLNDLASNYQQVLQRHQQQLQCQQQQQQHDGQSSEPTLGAAGAQPEGEFLQLMPAINYARNFIQATIGNQTRHYISTAIGGRAGGGGGSGGGAGPSNTTTAIAQQLVGSCTYHAYECSGGVGAFLRIRNCQILLLSGRSKGCYMPAPYIDDHGETDFGLLRGNPLHLNRQYYEKLQQMWLSHAIPEQVSRFLEYSSYASNINWYLH